MGIQAVSGPGNLLFDPDRLPAGWRRLQPGETHPCALYAVNLQTGEKERLVFEPRSSVLWRLFGWTARVFILRDRLAVVR